MANKKNDRYVVTLYTSDGTIVTSYWAASEDAAHHVCIRIVHVNPRRQFGFLGIVVVEGLLN